jgi:hypothetical protein
LNYDGTSPSAFTSSTYLGMDGWSDGSGTEEEDEFENLGDVMDEIFDGGMLITSIFRLFSICLFQARDVCFNPLNWL